MSSLLSCEDVAKNQGSGVSVILFLQEYGINKEEKLEIAIGFCLPLIKKIQLDLQRTHEDESVNKLHPL